MKLYCKPASRIDVAMKNIWFRLREDISRNLGFEVCKTQADALKESVSSFRQRPCGSWLNLPPYFAKCYIQLDKFLKKYRFDDDLYTDDELYARAVDSFDSDNIRITKHCSTKQSSYVVMQRARLIIKDILGAYDLEEHIRSCRFAKNASVGSPFSRSYLDQKLLEAPLSGSREHIRWFKDYVLPDDRILSGMLHRRLSKDKTEMYSIVPYLPQTFVPKAFDKLRGITPNTLLGSFYTYGLGMVIRARLKENCGIDLAKQQELHGRLVKNASINRVLVTGDLSSASQSITSWHIKKMFPRDWSNKLHFGRIPDVAIDDRIVRSSTFAGMGVGFTFPLQTLVFYSLIKAIQELTRTKGLISVYGDDLIYPRAIHKYVVSVFQDIGFIFNESKTYAKEFFRESCGCDYYHGIDCRPVSPSRDDWSDFGQCYTATLYKIRNNLSRKWNEVELSRTFYYIDCEIAGSSGEINFVPPNFPDTAGIRTNNPCAWRDYNICYNKPRWINDKQAWAFRYLKAHMPLQAVHDQAPFYWDNRRASSMLSVLDAMGPWDDVSTSSFRWKRSKKRWKSLTSRDLVHSKLHPGVTYRKLYPFVSQKGKVSYRLTVEVGTHSFEWPLSAVFPPVPKLKVKESYRKIYDPVSEESTYVHYVSLVRDVI